MPSAHISSYTAHIGRLGPLGSDRLIVLSHKLVAEGAPDEHRSEIYFADRFGEQEGGFHTTGAPDNVRAHLPAADYTAWIDLLRNESPVYLHWTTSDVPGTSETDGIIHLATGPEPTGEGPVDFSA